MPDAGRLSILHVLAPARFGGLESVVRGLAVGHARRGHRVRVAAITLNGGEPHPVVSSMQQSEVEAVEWPVGHRAYLEEFRRVRDACRSWRPAVVHTHGYHADVVAGGAARWSGVPVASTVHGFLGGGWKNRLYERLQRWAFRGFDAVVPVSGSLAESLAADGVPSDRIHPVPNAWGEHVEPMDRESARRALGIVTDAPVIGWVGRIGREKGLDVLLDALGGLSDERWLLAVVGEGSEREVLRERARSLGLGARLDWIGAVDDAGRYFRAFDLFCLSSRTEGMPVVLFEAMAAGVPVVATRVGGVGEMLDGESAWLCPPEDPRCLRSALGEALGDPARRSVKASRAAERLDERFGLEGWLDHYETLYRSIAAEERDGGRRER